MDKDIIIKLFEKKEYKAIKSIFDTMNPVDTATLLPEFEEKEMVLLFRLATMASFEIFALYFISIVNSPLKTLPW